MELSNNGGVNIRSYERCASAEGTFVFAANYILSSAKLFSTMEKELKRRKPNWSESELMALAEAVAPHFRVLKGKFSAFITSERKNQLWQDIANQVNAVAMVNRTTEEMKKKWADMQSLTKKKEAERRRSMKQTGGGPAPNFMFKNWENLVLQSLSDVAIEGISGGVDTAECESRPSPVVPAGIIIHEVPASENSELSESASTPCASMYMY
ncbi:myb-related transcription factor, partner of profilin-like [Crassostrea angulata]|uniref:myb-related transcription factor, partner of profilin-like n=1 Tax=Magallana angulata TaxID=2784310 RepID=UPI0022B1FDC9|nr:myb-related transcription factor, partner of profilin-like [Crassostrea angulata]